MDLAEKIEKLTEEERAALNILIGNKNESKSSVNSLLAGLRFTKKRVCPFCGGTHVVKNGKRADGTQKYICRECGRNPLATSNSLLCGTHKDLATWLKFIECELNDEPLKQTAEKCGIHLNTALDWRHKLYEAVSNSKKEVQLSGNIEMDETYPAVSYKGNHSRNKEFTMPREPHKRGSQVNKRGLSDELLCIPCAIDDAGNVIGRSVKCGAVSYAGLNALYSKEKIADHSTFITDSCKAYILLSGACNAELVQIPAGEHTNGEFNIQRVNSFHTSFMTLIAKQLQQALGADYTEIETVTPYPAYGGFNSKVVSQGQREVDEGFQPEIKPLSVNVADYDVVAIGTPTWWYTMAPAVLTFLNANDWSQKTVIPFMTHGGWSGHVIKDIQNGCVGAKFLPDMKIQFDSQGGSNMLTSQADINAWIERVTKAI